MLSEVTAKTMVRRLILEIVYCMREEGGEVLTLKRLFLMGESR